MREKERREKIETREKCRERERVGVRRGRVGVRDRGSGRPNLAFQTGDAGSDAVSLQPHEHLLLHRDVVALAGFTQRRLVRLGQHTHT